MHEKRATRHRDRRTWKPVLLAILSALAWGLSGFAWGQQTLEGELYVVRPGDTCQDIVRRSGGSLTLASFHALNPSLVGPGPHLLVPETTVRIRAGRSEGAVASLTYVKPEVKTVQPGRGPVSAEVGQSLYPLDQVFTERAAACEITFQDRSFLQLGEQSVLVVYGQSKQRTSVKTRQVRLESGAVAGGLSSLRGELGAPLRVETPAASIQVASPELAIEVDGQKSSLVSVYQGRVEVSGKGRTVSVGADYGTVTRLGKVPEAPRPLPQAPEWVEWPGGLKRITTPTASTTFAWTAVQGAQAYLLELARDPGFRQELTAVRVDGTRVERSLPPGRWYARVAARDGAGLRSAFSPVPELAVVRLELVDERGEPVRPDAGLASGGPRDDVLMARGAVKVVVAEPGSGQRLRLAPLEGRGGEAKGVEAGLLLDRPGIYVLTVEAVEGQGGPSLQRLLISVMPRDAAR